MCISIPGRIVSIQGYEAELDVLGARRKASTLLIPEVKVGDYVLTSAGSIVRRLDEAEAQASLALFQELMALEFNQEDQNLEKHGNATVPAAQQGE